MNMKPKLRKLKNGLPVLLVPQKGTRSMTLLVLCRVGSRYESKDINGASHFIEHLMFIGTKKRPTTEILTRELDRYGAEYNAFTGKDMTGYYIKMDAEKTPLAVDMLNDMIFHSTYDPKEIDRERGVIIEEINMYEDNPRMHLEDILEEALFAGSTLGWSIAGPREVIRSVSREKLVAYRDAYYIPSRMTIAVAGKIVPGIMPILEKTFGRIKRDGGKDEAFAPFAPPKKIADPIGYQEKNTEQVQFSLAFHGLKLGDKDLAAASLLATILGGTMSSRLFIQIRERRGLCYSISASHQPMEDTGVFSISAGLEKKRFHEAFKAIMAEVRKTLRSRVTAEELRRAKDHIRGKTLLAFEDSANQADWYGRQWLFRHKVETPEERMKRFEAVTSAQIARVAKRIFRKESMAVAVIGPFGKKSELKKKITWKL